MTDEWLSGPELYRWLRQHGLTRMDSQLGSTNARAVRHWRSGSTASLYTADRVLTKLGRALWEIEGEVPAAPPPQRGPRRQS